MGMRSTMYANTEGVSSSLASGGGSSGGPSLIDTLGVSARRHATGVLLTELECNSARRITHNGGEYIVADVVAARAMELNGGYVPAEEFARSVPEWEHMPVPIGHPVSPNGEFISARIPPVIESAVIGYFQNVDFDETLDALVGELWVEVDKALSLGDYGQRVVDILENGETLEVSTAYRADQGSPGMYDGEYRDVVRVNLRPDHLAVLPDDLGPGKCSAADGCGVNPDASAAVNADILEKLYDVQSKLPPADVPIEVNDVSIHSPSWSGKTDSGSWSRPAMDDFGTDDLSEIDDHFIASRSGFPPENYGDLLLPVVSSNGNLSLPGLRAAASRLSAVHGLSDDEESRIRSMITRLANEEFDADFGENTATPDNSGSGTRVEALNGLPFSAYRIGGEEARTADRVYLNTVPAPADEDAASDPATEAGDGESSDSNAEPRAGDDSGGDDQDMKNPQKDPGENVKASVKRLLELSSHNSDVEYDVEITRIDPDKGDGQSGAGCNCGCSASGNEDGDGDGEGDGDTDTSGEENSAVNDNDSGQETHMSKYHTKLAAQTGMGEDELENIDESTAKALLNAIEEADAADDGADGGVENADEDGSGSDSNDEISGGSDADTANDDADDDAEYVTSDQLAQFGEEIVGRVEDLMENKDRKSRVEELHNELDELDVDEERYENVEDVNALEAIRDIALEANDSTADADANADGIGGGSTGTDFSGLMPGGMVDANANDEADLENEPSTTLASRLRSDD